AAENEASDVIGLASGAGKVVHALQEELEAFLRRQLGHAADGAEPAVFAEFHVLLVESLDHAVRVEDQSVTRPQIESGSFVRDGRSNAQGQSTHFKFLQGALRAAKNRRIVAGIDVSETARCGVVFRENSRREAPAIQT